MLRKLRIFLTALLLVPVLVSSANAFTAGDGATFDPAKPKAGWCYYYASGVWFAWPC